MTSLGPNPYTELADAFVAPRPEQVLCGSSMLAAFGVHANFVDPLEVAFAEYAFFTRHTYFFELVGLQLLGEMTARLRSHGAIGKLALQAVDEARHVEVYARVLESLGMGGDGEVPERLHHTLVLHGTLEEKLVRAFVVLESLAMGLFSARAKFFRETAVCRVDRRILLEESQHQANGLDIVLDFMRDGRISFAQVVEASRVAIDQVGEILSPEQLLSEQGIDAGETETNLLHSMGVLKTQRDVTKRCIKHALRKLRAGARELH